MKRVTSNKPISFRHHSLSLSLLLLSSFRDRVTLIHRASPSPLKQSLSIIFPFLSPDGELYENSAIFIRPKLTRRMVKQRSTRALNMLICVIALAGIFEWGGGGRTGRARKGKIQIFLDVCLGSNPARVCDLSANNVNTIVN